jgi:hypothetical protein
MSDLPQKQCVFCQNDLDHIAFDVWECKFCPLLVRYFYPNNIDLGYYKVHTKDGRLAWIFYIDPKCHGKYSEIIDADHILNGTIIKFDKQIEVTIDNVEKILKFYLLWM